MFPPLYLSSHLLRSLSPFSTALLLFVLLFSPFLRCARELPVLSSAFCAFRVAASNAVVDRETDESRNAARRLKFSSSFPSPCRPSDRETTTTAGKESSRKEDSSTVMAMVVVVVMVVCTIRSPARRRLGRLLLPSRGRRFEKERERGAIRSGGTRTRKRER